jgi:hypothetical protein
MKIRAKHKQVKNAVLDHYETHTAPEIAVLTGLDKRSIYIAAKYLGVQMKPAKRGGIRIKGQKCSCGANGVCQESQGEVV